MACWPHSSAPQIERGKKDAFWEYLDTEVIEATKAGSGLIIQMDGNLWAGKEIIPNDPRPQNKNGQLFEQFLKLNSHLSVVNGLDLCEGLITRRRSREGKIEKSVLDFFIVCNLVLPHVTRMVIDEDRRHVLTNYEQVRRGGKANDTDHATEYIDLEIVTVKPKRQEVWNFKNKEAQKKFKVLTTETEEFSNCFKNNLPILKQIENWRNALNSNIKKAFKRVRIKSKPEIKSLPPEALNLIDLRNQLVFEDGNDREIEQLNEAISDIEAEMNHNKIMRNFQNYS